MFIMNLFFIYLTIFVNIIGFGLIFPLLPAFAKQFNASDLTIGFLGASFAISQFIFSPILGRFSDFFGRKPIIALSLAGNALAYLFFGLSNSLIALFILRFLQGIFSSAALPVANAYVADITSPKERVSAMGKLGASLALGFIVGPAMGGLLAKINFSLPFFAASVLALLNLLSVIFLLPESLKNRCIFSAKHIIEECKLANVARLKNGLKGAIAPLFILAFLWSFGLSNNQVSIPLFAMEHFEIGIATIGFFFALMGLTSSVTQSLLLTRITSRFTEHKTIIFGIGLMGFSLFLMSFAWIPLLMAFLMMTMAFGSGLSRPVINALVSKESSGAEQGTAMGTVFAFESFGRILGPLMGGALFNFLGPQFPFIFSGIILVGSVILLRRHFLGIIKA